MRTATPNIFSARRRRGSAYLLVLGASLMVTILGISVITIAQINGRMTNMENNATECEILAQGALEYAAAKINADSAWRATYGSIFTPNPVSLGRGTITFKITDTSGNAISQTNMTQPVKVWGIARIGTTCRVFSCTFSQFMQPLAVLKTSLHSGGSVNVGSNLTTVNGPISSNATMNVHANVTGDVQGIIVTNNGNVSGKMTTLSAPLTMPPSTTYNTYYQYGTDLPYAWTGNIIQNILLSSTSNPYGPVNPYGVYRINIPAGQTLTIKNSRIVATLVINLGLSSTLNITGPILIQPPRQDFPTMIVNTALISTVTFNSGNNTLAEGGSNPNFNPSGTPYNGTTNSTTSDSYPSQIMGLVHVIGSTATINLQSDATFIGCLVADAALPTANHDTFQADKNLAKFPPMGYTQIGGWGPVSGTYHREQDN